MRTFGLVGYPLSHSFSAKYFAEKFEINQIKDCEYKLFPIKNISEITSIVDNDKNLVGLNITIPYKESVLGYLHEIDETALKIGAVNTIKINRENNKTILKGFNTDVIGFEKSLKPLLKKHHKSALILGTGGASKAIKFVLEKLGINYNLVSRSKTSESIMEYSKLNKKNITENLLIINTTPLGMFPNTDDFPEIPYEYITQNHLLFDLIYNPEKTTFLIKGEIQNAQVKNGLEMLRLQADASWEIWNL